MGVYEGEYVREYTCRELLRDSMFSFKFKISFVN